MDFFQTPSRPSSIQRRPSRQSEPAWEEADGATWREIALKLVEADRLGVYGGEDWSCNDLELYGACAHGFTPEQTVEVLRIGRKLLELTEVDRAFSHGWLTWEQVVLLTRVAVSRHEGPWLDRALDLASGDLALLVERSAEGWAPPVAGGSREEAGGTALDSIADALDATTWRRRARVPCERFSGGPRHGGRRLRGQIAVGRVRPPSTPGLWRKDGAPNVRHALRVAFSSA